MLPISKNPVVKCSAFLPNGKLCDFKKENKLLNAILSTGR